MASIDGIASFSRHGVYTNYDAVHCAPGRRAAFGTDAARASHSCTPPTSTRAAGSYNNECTAGSLSFELDEVLAHRPIVEAISSRRAQGVDGCRAIGDLIPLRRFRH